MRNLLKTLLAAALLIGMPAFAQSIPEIAFDAAREPLKMPDNVYLGENVGIAQNSKGDIFVLTRTGHPYLTEGTSRPFAHGGTKLYEFNRSGKFVREIGQDTYGFLMGQMVRVDPQDNIWTVDQGTNMIIKWDPTGNHVLLLLGRKAESEPIPNPNAPPRPPNNGAGAQSDIFNRPTDVAWDSAGNIYISDGNANNRVAKFDKNGKFIKTWGSRGSAPGQIATPHGIVIDAQDNIYVAERGNKRIQIFDADGNYKRQITNVGTPSALCITPGPHQYLYSSDSNPSSTIDTGGPIYKLELDGTILGKFGKAGLVPGQFGSVNSMICANENEFWVAEMISWRVQKLSLHPQATQTAKK